MKLISAATTSLLGLNALVQAAKFEEYILAPASRTVKPISVYAVDGNVENAEALLDGNESQDGVTFGSNTSATLDFGKNIAATVHFNVTSVTGDDEYLGFSFTESSEFISPYHCDSALVDPYDAPQWYSIPSTGDYGGDKFHQRGGFRYLSIWHNSTGSVTVGDFFVNFTASPEMEDMRDYKGYFNSDSEKLNRVWYAGAYTNQLCIADPSTGNALGGPGEGWVFNANIADGTSVLMDGAKRDRLVWPGDMVISAPSVFVSTNSLDGIRNALDSLFLLQQSDGRLPWVGRPLASDDNFIFSFTYHLYTLLDLYLYYLYTGDENYLSSYWDQYKLAIEWSVGTIDDSGMANVTSSNDWLRSWMGGHNVEANSILYHTLEISLQLADLLDDHSQDDTWTSAMSGIKTAVNEALWDSSANLYLDNDEEGNTLHPQDGNSWVIISGVADADRADLISTALMNRWVRPYGAPAPEAGTTISPFATGFEVQAHFLSGHPERAIELIEFMWADFMLDDPQMTNSSLIEGYDTSGDVHYPPYSNDARVSHAHGWASGPTSSLTFLAAGLTIEAAAGSKWAIQPQLGGLGRVEAGFTTSLGAFEVAWEGSGDGGAVSGSFTTPDGTEGVLILPGTEGNVAVEGPDGEVEPSSSSDDEVRYERLAGGAYSVRLA